MGIDGTTKLYGIIGNPVSHSLSPAMHNAAFTELGENRVYLPFPVDDVSAAMQGIKALNIMGASVTIPHKEEVIPYLDRIDPLAAKIGAVNTINREKHDGVIKLCGYNTDWLGAIKPLKKDITLVGTKVILLGAGGSARAIGFGLLKENAQVVLCSRTESRGRNLAADLGCDWHSLDKITTLKGAVLINATSVGMHPHENETPVPTEILPNFHVVMDIVYAPLKTKLLKAAKEVGCRTINGLEMLLYQGIAQFELWTGLAAPEEVMRHVLREVVKDR